MITDDMKSRINNDYYLVQDDKALWAIKRHRHPEPARPVDAKMIDAIPAMVAALTRLSTGYKYSVEVREIARASLAKAGLR